MKRQGRKRWTLFGASLGAITTLALVVGMGVLAGTGAAAGSPPSNTTPPKIIGTAQVNKTLTAAPGKWSGSTPITFTYHWQRCGKDGDGCSYIKDFGRHHTVTAADVGDTLRVVVTAKNSAGTSTAASAPTAVIASPSAPANTAMPTVSGT